MTKTKIILELSYNEADSLRHLLSYVKADDVGWSDLEDDLLSICNSLNLAGVDVPNLPKKKIELNSFEE